MLSSSFSTVRSSGFAESTSTRAIALYVHKTIYKWFRVTYDLRNYIAITVLLFFSLYFPLATFSCFVRDSNKRPFSKFKGGCLFEGGLLFEDGRLLDNFTFRMGAYSRVGAYSRGALIRSITVI